MASTSETGHAKNVANFESMISICEGYGSAYNPSKNAIKITQLKSLLENAKNAMSAVNTAKTAYDNASNAREIGFTNLRKLCTRLVNALDASEASDQIVKDAKTINRKIQGSRAKTKTASTTTAEQPQEPRQISVSQLSFDSQVDNFGKLITLVASEPSYAPNEAELQVSTLNATLENLKSLNNAVINAKTQYDNAIIARNKALYNANTGIVDTALEVKKYVKSVFGASDPNYKQISGLKFTRTKK
ncbi:MAG TPA: hypothetical protein PKU81_06755 [Bacteroidales bacterium]|jgi:HPt (histidine-containing phosphotransfer) domain-containing protein|nr:hypothetical protein [Bacteroidales bacterium]